MTAFDHRTYFIYGSDMQIKKRLQLPHLYF
jgi:hypothetical protein